MGRGCNDVGNRHFMAGPTENDPAEFKPYAGRKRQFLGLARWVVPGTNDRDKLRAAAADLAPGSGQPDREPLPRDRGRRRPAVPGGQAPARLLPRRSGGRDGAGQVGSAPSDGAKTVPAAALPTGRRLVSPLDCSPPSATRRLVSPTRADARKSAFYSSASSPTVNRSGRSPTLRTASRTPGHKGARCRSSRGGS